MAKLSNKVADKINAVVITFAVSLFVGFWIGKTVYEPEPPPPPAPQLTYFDTGLGENIKGVKLSYEGDDYYATRVDDELNGPWYSSDGNPIDWGCFGLNGATLSKVYKDLTYIHKGKALIEAARTSGQK